MNELVLSKSLMKEDAICGDLMMMAERELSAFFTTVTELFGSEQAEASVEDWLDGLMACGDLPTSTRQWRTLTIAAAARLASRANSDRMGSKLFEGVRGHVHPQFKSHPREVASDCFC
jgi:hypothetical protein